MMATMVPEPAAGGLVSLYESHYSDLVRLAAVLVDRDSAEEIVQDAFVSVARRPGGLADLDSAEAYLRQAVVNGSRSHLRKRGTRRRHLASISSLPTELPADAELLRTNEHRRVIAALSSLSRRQREVLILRYHADLSEAEIAEALGISAGSVKTHASRGLARLRTLLEEQDR